MSDFSREWLRLREPYDEGSRSLELVRKFAAALPSDPRIADLAAGDGANKRFLAPHLPRSTRWVLVDSDARLLPRDETALQLDLARTLDAIPSVDAVTCSAFLDLVSASWLKRFVGWLAGRPFLAALTVDGRVAFDPGDAEDATVLAAFAADQTRDKGFGPALGSRASECLVRLLNRKGYRVHTAQSDWRLGARDREIIAGMIESFALGQRSAWQERRRAQADAGMLTIMVGHTDLVATAG
jgi:hypothetical protein